MAVDASSECGESPRTSGDGDAESILQTLLSSPHISSAHSRLAGGTEYTWCRTVAGGSGISVLALLFSNLPDPDALQQAIHKLQIDHPRLRSQLVWIHAKPAFLVSNDSVTQLQIVDAPNSARNLQHSDHTIAGNSSANSNETIDQSETDSSALKLQSDEVDRSNNWMSIVETELNTNEWTEHRHSLDPKPMFGVRLYKLVGGRSLMVLRIHTAISDRTSAATILTELLNSFYEIKHGHPLIPQKPELNSCATNARKHPELMAVEEAIPKGQANKPFWAHGVDVLGYSLTSRRHGLLPFIDINPPRRSEIAHLSCSVEQTQKILQMCVTQKTNLFGALSAAGLKAAATCKQIGNHSENFGMITLVDCRNLLDPVLSSSTVGFYHSAVLNTHNLNETVEFWDMARRCSNSLDNAMKNRKHFTDIGDVNFLVCQAMQHPHLTPSSSLRTSLMVLFKEPVFDDMEDLKKAVHLENYIGCSSVHGVGPSVVIFDIIQHGALTCTCVYPAPLHSRQQIEGVLNSMRSILLMAVS